MKVSKVDEENVDSGQLPFTGPKCGKTEIPMDIQPEPEVECNRTERLKGNTNEAGYFCTCCICQDRML